MWGIRKDYEARRILAGYANEQLLVRCSLGELLQIVAT